MHYPYVRPVRTGVQKRTRMYGPYRRAICMGAFLTLLCMGVRKGVKKYTHMYSPYKLAICTGRTYG